LTLTLGLALPAQAGRRSNEPSLGDRIAAVADTYERKRPPLSLETCNGLILDILSDVGVTDLRGGVSGLWQQLKDQGATHQRKRPNPGDLVFWHRTYDSNRNKRIDDRFTHIGVVISVDDEGTVEMVHRASSGIRGLRMNLSDPALYKSDGVVWNDYLAASGYGRDNERLSGQLFAGFATVGSRPELRASTPAVAKVPKAPKAPKAPKVSASDQADDGIWSWEDDVDSWRLQRVERGRKVPRWEVAEATCEELWTLRNAVYARHGYLFNHRPTQELFGSIPWYQADPNVTSQTVSDYLSRRDLVNVKRIQKREKQDGCP
jgi:hypothetical protein